MISLRTQNCVFQAHKKSIFKSPILPIFQINSVSRARPKKVQTWMGIRLDPTEWGFRIKNGLLVPVMIDNGVRMAPDAVLDFISSAHVQRGANRIDVAV